MENATVVQRPDSDIEEDIRIFARSYDPLKQARGHFDFSSKNGHVTLRGNVRTMQARRVLVDNVPDIPGVVSMDARGLYDDETLRIELGKVLPPGVLVRINYGSVVISVTPDQEKKQAAALLKKAQKVGGVRTDKVKVQVL